mgnify:CR=1 FL=1
MRIGTASVIPRTILMRCFRLDADTCIIAVGNADIGGGDGGDDSIVGSEIAVDGGSNCLSFLFCNFDFDGISFWNWNWNWSSCRSGC